MDRRSYLVAAGSSLSVGLAGCIAGTGAAGEYDVGMSQTRFRPTELTVEAGTTVTFRNTSSHGHTVTAFQDAYPDGAEYFASGGYESQAAAEEAWKSSNSGILQQGQVFEHEFTVPGTYDYLCIPHLRAGMTGQVVVTG